ncbi:peptidoglycan DD-metalloendopeptidase family protein [Altererythrobacter aquaemixtae]|uniref:Peptidoglycan DD-metalloendopeptidase family protein n=2 Tax=Pontixanthobacter aquaemixtae TaxID=1958940 RepID=A0A844ZUB5_9SPHN|nr:peptidoglycan DD-metalloendopeptidase family protein [Pontixanthobacter aquaemixtae]
MSLSGCSGTALEEQAPETGQAEVVQPISTPAARPAPVSTPSPSPSPTPPPGPTTFVFDGELTQGGWIRGQAPGGTVTATLGSQTLTLDDGGHFFAAFDRDAGSTETLVARLSDGRRIESPIAISPRTWDIERVNVAKRPSGSSEAWWKRREPEYNAIVAARAMETGATGWRQDFIWPVTGRISGRFGRQRIYRGEPGSYHSGIDIAGGNGTPFVAPADGVVTLATTQPFSLEGYLLIIDHGQGLNSAFLHMSKIAVRDGETVRQGQYIGNIGASGRATGPHLHWGLKWRDARLDPLLFTGPMR